LCRIETEKLSRRNGELEAASRKLRGQVQDADIELERLGDRASRAEAQAKKYLDRIKQLKKEAAEAAAAAEAALLKEREEALAQVNAVRSDANTAVQATQEQSARRV
jgi:chromosome segregation ATPase